MKDEKLKKPVFSIRDAISSFVALQWLVLLSVAMLNFILHWRYSEVIRIIEMSWVVVVLFLTVLILSSRYWLAIRLVYFLTSAFMLAYLIACVAVGGIDSSALVLIAYMIVVLVAATWQFHRNRVLFGPTEERGISED